MVDIRELNSMDDLLQKERSYIFESKLSDAVACRKAGTQCYRDESWSKAAEFYQRGLYHVEFDEASFAFELLEHHRQAVNDIRLPLYLNLSACYLKLKQPDKVIELADQACQLDGQNVKALYRGALGHMQLNNHEQALERLKKAFQLAPNDASVRKSLQTLREQIKTHHSHEKELWTKAFGSTTTNAKMKQSLGIINHWTMICVCLALSCAWWLATRATD